MKHKKMQKKSDNGDDNDLSDHHEHDESDDVSYEDQSNISDIHENATTVPNRLNGYDVASLVTHHSLREASQDVVRYETDGEEIDVVDSDTEKS